jgi:hypothetical protein
MRIRISLILSLLLLLNHGSVQACPFCSAQGQTLLGEVGQADMILYGTMKNAKRDGDNYGSGTTEFHIEKIVKAHPSITGKMVVLPRYIPADPKVEYKHLIFVNLLKNNALDPYRGVAVLPKSKIAEYLVGSMELKGKDAVSRLTYFFNYLDNEDSEVANDAYIEFGNASYADFRKMAEKLPPEKIAGWLLDPNTPLTRFGLYGSMLGHCGKSEHIATFEQFLNDPRKKQSSGVDGILAGYVLLDRQKGWDYVLKILSDEKNEFFLRYAALRAIRFFWDDRPDVVNRKDLLKGVSSVLEQSDICDFAIEDLRKWQCWDLSEKVFLQAGLETHQVPIIQRATIRYALSLPAPTKASAEFLDRIKKADPEKIKETEELMKLEKGPTPKKP